MKKKIIGYDIVSYGNTLNNIIENDINPKIIEIDSLLNNVKWQGITKESFENKYNSVIFELKKIPKVLDLYNKILFQIMNNFEDMIYELRSDFEELEFELNQKGDFDGKKSNS